MEKKYQVAIEILKEMQSWPRWLFWYRVRRNSAIENVKWEIEERARIGRSLNANNQ